MNPNNTGTCSSVSLVLRFSELLTMRPEKVTGVTVIGAVARCTRSQSLQQNQTLIWTGAL